MRRFDYMKNRGSDFINIEDNYILIKKYYKEIALGILVGLFSSLLLYKFYDEQYEGKIVISNLNNEIIAKRNIILENKNNNINFNITNDELEIRIIDKTTKIVESKLAYLEKEIIFEQEKINIGKINNLKNKLNTIENLGIKNYESNDLIGQLKLYELKNNYQDLIQNIKDKEPKKIYKIIKKKDSRLIQIILITNILAISISILISRFFRSYYTKKHN